MKSKYYYSHIEEPEKLRELSINDYAKIRREGERFWVIVEGKSDEGYVGKVNNELTVAPYKFGETIAFLANEVLSVIPSEEIEVEDGK